MLPILSPDVVTTLPLLRPVRSLSVIGIWVSSRGEMSEGFSLTLCPLLYDVNNYPPIFR